MDEIDKQINQLESEIAQQKDKEQILKNIMINQLESEKQMVIKIIQIEEKIEQDSKQISKVQGEKN